MLQLRNDPWYRSRAANSRPTHSSVRSRSQEKYSGIGAGLSASTPRKAASKLALLEYWWFTGRPWSRSVGMDADHSLDMTTASRSSSTAASTAIADRIPVTGTCPLRKPSSAERSSCGSISRSARTTGSPVTAAGSSIAANRSAGLLTTNSAVSASRRTRSTTTIESIPPPKGTRARGRLVGSRGSGVWASARRASMRSEVRSKVLR